MVSLIEAAVQSSFFTLFFDGVVLANTVFVGMEVDNASSAPGLFEVWRHAICGLYLLEVLLRLYAYGREYYLNPWSALDTLVVALAITDVWVLGQAGWLWRSSLLRALRFLRLWETVKHSRPLGDLWLVLGGIVGATRPIFYLGLLLGLALYACGSAITGMLHLAPDDPAEEALRCLSGPGNTCLDLDEYFGTVSRSVLTLLQMITLDSWASHIVRPLYITHPMESFFLVCFVVTTAYGLLSAAIGVFVWSTVELAKNHEGNESHVAAKLDKEIVDALCAYFEASLSIEERTMIDRRSMLEAMAVPQVATAIKKLELPVADIHTLFDHLDVKRKGEISIQEFEAGVLLLKKPAASYDLACLTARIGGSVTYANQLMSRTCDVLNGLEDMSMGLEATFAHLHELVKPEGTMGAVPEVLLRKGGRIEYSREPSAGPRYTD